MQLSYIHTLKFKIVNTYIFWSHFAFFLPLNNSEIICSGAHWPLYINNTENGQNIGCFCKLCYDYSFIGYFSHLLFCKNRITLIKTDKNGHQAKVLISMRENVKSSKENVF